MPTTQICAAIALIVALFSSTGEQHFRSEHAPATPGAPAWWRPEPGTSWQIQFGGELDTSLNVAMYVVDLIDTPEATIADLHEQGRRVICYFSAGSHEDWRPDVDNVPPEAIGDPLDDWPGERWLDVRAAPVYELARARLDLAVAKNCDGVDPDNVDGYLNDTGFPLTDVDQLKFNLFLSDESHARGLAVGLKNDLDQIPALVASFDWALNEECFAYDECNTLLPFVESGKPVFQIEYGPPSLAESVCPRANDLGFDTLIKNLDLDAALTSCHQLQ